MRSLAKVNQKRGKIERKPCQVCGSDKSEMHHPDYELPLFVVWLCRPCHLAWHAHWRDILPKAFAEWLWIAKTCADARNDECLDA